MSKEKNNNKKVNNGVFASLKIINKVKNIFDALLQYKSLVIFAVPIVVCIVKLFWGTYMRGKFSVYKIDPSYIDTNNGSFIANVVEITLIIIVFLLSNVVFYFVCSRKKRAISIIGMVGMCFGEGVVFMYLLFRQIKNIVAILFLSILSGILNFNGILYGFDKNKRSTNSKKNKKSARCDIKNKGYIVACIVVVAVLVGCTFLFYHDGKDYEKSRKSYKVMMKNIVEDTDIKYQIYSIDDNKKYEIYPVAYESKEKYILCRLYYDKGKIKIDYHYQKIIDKDGQEIRYFDNIYDISGKENITKE